MPTTQFLGSNIDLAKGYVSSSRLPDEYKALYIQLLNISAQATNGISPEEKIQKMTECISLLAVSQGMYISSIDERIDRAVQQANQKQCEKCKAMKHVVAVEAEKHDKELIEAYEKSKGHDSRQDEEEHLKLSWSNIVKTALMKPYIYIVMCIMFVSPYSVDIVKTLCQFFAK